MKLLKTVLATVALAVFATSCEKPDNPLHENYIEQDCAANAYFSVIHKKSVNQDAIVQGTSYLLRWRSDFTADIYVYDAKFSVRMPDGIDIAFEGLKWTYNEGVKVILEKDVVPTWVKMNGQEVDASTYVLNELKINVLERRLLGFSPEYIPMINMSMTMGDIEVVTVQKNNVYFGTTGVVDNASSSYFSSKTPVYYVALDPSKMTATVNIYKAKFAERMPAMDMKFPEIPLEVSSTGCKLFVKEVVPTIEDVPYPDYMIKNLNGNMTYATGLDLRFDCMTYSVTAQLGYPIVED